MPGAARAAHQHCRACMPGATRVERHAGQDMQGKTCRANPQRGMELAGAAVQHRQAQARATPAGLQNSCARTHTHTHTLSGTGTSLEARPCRLDNLCVQHLSQHRAWFEGMYIRYCVHACACVFLCVHACVCMPGRAHDPAPGALQGGCSGEVHLHPDLLRVKGGIHAELRQKLLLPAGGPAQAGQQLRLVLLVLACRAYQRARPMLVQRLRAATEPAQGPPPC